MFYFKLIPTGVHCTEDVVSEVQLEGQASHMRHPDVGIHGKQAETHQGRSFRCCQRCIGWCRLRNVERGNC